MLDHIAQAHRDIDQALTVCTQPFAISSFGKDSLVLLHLLSQHGVNRILHLEDADEVVDWPFIQGLTVWYQLEVTPLSRGRALFMVIGDTPLFTALSFCNDHHLTVFPTQMLPYEGIGSYVCVDAELNAMRGYALPVEFDCLFSGVKHTDLTSKACLSFMNLLSQS